MAAQEPDPLNKRQRREITWAHAHRSDMPLPAFSPDQFAIRIQDGDVETIRQALADAFPEIDVSEDPLGETGKTNILVTFRPPENEDISHYDWIHSLGAGFDQIAAALQHTDNKPIITRTHGTMGRQMGEYCLTYTLAHLQKIATRQTLQTEHNWWRKKASPDYCFDQSVAIFGTGEIGKGIAEVFSLMRAKVTGFSRSGRAVEGFDRTHAFGDFQVGHGFDVIISALPATPDTKDLLNADVFAKFDGALFINVGRGATVDEDALKHALDKGQVGHAVLDVMKTEPLPEDHWMWSHPKVTLTPHVSGLTRPQDAADALIAHLQTTLETGRLPDTVFDPDRGY